MAEFVAVIVCLLLFAGMLALLEAGYRMARRFEVTRGDESTGIFDTAIFALLGLLLAFAFAGAMDRLNVRRDLIVEEANAIGTAYMRVDLLPAADQPAIRVLFKDYVTARLDVYRIIDGGGDGTPVFQRIESLQKAIWSAAVVGVSRPGARDAIEVVLPAINEMIDVTTKRRVALDTRLSTLVLVLLVAMSLLSALLAGASMARQERRRMLHGGIYATAIALTIYTILDLDNPRGGLIGVDGAERVLLDLGKVI